MSGLVEITKEFFDAIIKSDDKNTEVNTTRTYTDVIYHKHGVKLVYRSQMSGCNYYIEDINL